MGNNNKIQRLSLILTKTTPLLADVNILGAAVLENGFAMFRCTLLPGTRSHVACSQEAINLCLAYCFLVVRFSAVLLQTGVCVFSRVGKRPS